jgi:hypothetical protein
MINMNIQYPWKSKITVAIQRTFLQCISPLIFASSHLHAQTFRFYWMAQNRIYFWSISIQDFITFFQYFCSPFQWFRIPHAYQIISVYVNSQFYLYICTIQLCIQEFLTFQCRQRISLLNSIQRYSKENISSKNQKPVFLVLTSPCMYKRPDLPQQITENIIDIRPIQELWIDE